MFKNYSILNVLIGGNNSPTSILRALAIRTIFKAAYEMVLRYAHLSSDHLREAAERITGSNLVQGKLWVVK